MATAAGTGLGVAALVGIVGLARTAELQVSNRFDLLQATEVLGSVHGTVDPTQLERRLRDTDQVVEAGAFVQRAPSDVGLLSPPVQPSVPNVGIIAASSGFFNAREIEFSWGRSFDSGHIARGDRVAVIGSDVASRLGALEAASGPRSVWIGVLRYDVIGIVRSSPRMPSVLTSIVVPINSTQLPVDGQTSFTALTALGDATRVAPAIQYAAMPTDPDAVVVVKPPEPRDYVLSVKEDVRQLVSSAAAIALIIGALSIGGVTSTAVVERTSELGLRLALGAKRMHIVGQIVVEASLIGLWGGFVGAAMGVITVVVIASFNEWSPMVTFALAASGPLIGLFVGGLAGLVPAFRTASIQPDRALRTE